MLMLMAATSIIVIRPSCRRPPHRDTPLSASLMQSSSPHHPSLPHYPCACRPPELHLIPFLVFLALQRSPCPLPAIFAPTLWKMKDGDCRVSVLGDVAKETSPPTGKIETFICLQARDWTDAPSRSCLCSKSSKGSTSPSGQNPGSQTPSHLPCSPLEPRAPGNALKSLPRETPKLLRVPATPHVLVPPSLPTGAHLCPDSPSLPACIPKPGETLGIPTRRSSLHVLQPPLGKQLACPSLGPCSPVPTASTYVTARGPSVWTSDFLW